MGKSNLRTGPLAPERPEPDEARAVPPPSTRSRDRLGALYAEYARFVAWFASRLLSRQDEIEDIVQEVFVIAAGQLEKLTDPPQIRGWLKTVTLRRAGRLLRWKQVRARFGAGPESPPIEETVASPSASPEDRAAIRELLRVLESMPVKLRIAWTLRYMHEETVDGVAELAGCSLATAKRRIAAAQERIDRELKNG